VNDCNAQLLILSSCSDGKPNFVAPWQSKDNLLNALALRARLWQRPRGWQWGWPWL